MEGKESEFAKADEAKARMMSEPGFSVEPHDLAARYAAAREAQAEILARLSEVGAEVTALWMLIVDSFEGNGVTSVKLADGRSVGVQLEPYAKVTDRETYRQWLLSPGNEGLAAQMTLLWQTTNSLAKERLLEGEPDMPGVMLTSYPKIVLRKA